jgi:hypothetical protein
MDPGNDAFLTLFAAAKCTWLVRHYERSGKGIGKNAGAGTAITKIQ